VADDLGVGGRLLGDGQEIMGQAHGAALEPDRWRWKRFALPPQA
jgi:hypothetical protein